MIVPQIVPQIFTSLYGGLLFFILSPNVLIQVLPPASIAT